ncbi:UbiA family prenyltransferase (plasmid) [Phyllobacterium sp. A18/5-2]|uniref:UbiA family prenyltransferase n=1 Tax=Phyllobacterium sp. A18/5-2 TaxID=2978392 RepID=UPI0021C791D1|nr:UbiA family prenyltransferase [Phyllobacterium sp. A18/5-2]UXN66460.1 UbiA family prenyltransferase [Phyllobacterium sp. A18/5-2]
MDAKAFVDSMLNKPGTWLYPAKKTSVEPARPAPVKPVTSATDEPPLLVDLDRCLIRTDLLFETALAYLSSDPRRIFQMCLWLLRGRAHLKRQLAQSAVIDVIQIPVNAQVAAMANEEKLRGRQVFLVTAGDQLLADRMMDHLPFLDGTIGSDGHINLKGPEKLKRIQREFPDGFDYIGDCAADLPIWEKARKVVAVEPSASVAKAIGLLGKEAVILPRTAGVTPLLKAARLHQLAKNTLIFVPAILSGEIANPFTAFVNLMAFLGLSLVAVGTYLLNDLCDLSHDRAHWSKRDRPLASGALPLQTALMAAPLCIGAGFLIAVAIGPEVVAAFAAYLIATIAYSLRLKRVPVLDCVILAILFTLRLATGIAATNVEPSPWLLVFSMFLFASLSFAKRHTEVERMASRGGAVVSGRGYIATDAPVLLGLGVATASASILIMVLYLIFDAFSRSFYANPAWLWFLPLVLFLWVSRIWLLCARGELNDDPVAFAVRDPLSLWLGGALMAAFTLAWLGMPL